MFHDEMNPGLDPSTVKDNTLLLIEMTIEKSRLQVKEKFNQSDCF